MLGGAQAAVGAAAIFARFALTGTGAVAVSALRLTIAAAVLWTIALAGRRIRPESSPAPSAEHRRTFAFAGLALALHFASWIASLEYTSVAISTLLVATTPVWTALYDSIVRRRHLTPVAWGAMGCGAVGVFGIAGFSVTRPPVPGHEALGAILAIVGALAIAAYFLMVREVRSIYTTQTIVTRTYTWAAAALVLAAAATRQGPPALSDAPAWCGILGMALISQLLGHTGMNAALRWFSASAVAFTTLVEPVVAAFLAYFVFREGLTPIGVVGGILVLIALAVFLREEQPSGV